MSHINPAPDIKYLNDTIGQSGKKNLKNEEFKKRKLIHIVRSLAVDDPIQAQCLKSSIEAYYNHYDIAVDILKNVLKLTNNQSYLAWEKLLKLYIETADIDAFITTYLSALKQKFENIQELNALLEHMVSTYLITDSHNDAQLDLKLREFGKYGVYERVRQTQQLGVSLPVYRKIMALFYQEFYAQYNGKTQSFFNYESQDLIITVHTAIDNAKDLFDFNSHLQDVIMAWYAEANDGEQQQIEKVVIYVKHSTAIVQKGEIVA
ncbi:MULTISPECIES: hypothetical protein [unclassified Acinetobacter]|uniref:hypothetical protein n=1 Tax=unclassified Acinetobacter TaxID=196816 RepID=UPI001023F404|nr:MULTISPECIES: hypothetical protein [unclassified Acinetobacter]RZG76624.1 hypothetical protein EXE09_06215 [Acinetobacter sp. WCHAc060025]RZG77066.1 hypothetical protein EXE10_19450 [Acinetobacter sp. WCHAc060033]